MDQEDGVLRIEMDVPAVTVRLYACGAALQIGRR